MQPTIPYQYYLELKTQHKNRLLSGRGNINTNTTAPGQKGWGINLPETAHEPTVLAEVFKRETFIFEQQASSSLCRFMFVGSMFHP